MSLKEKWTEYLELRIKQLSKHPLFTFPTAIALAALVTSIALGTISYLQSDIASARAELQQIKIEKLNLTNEILTYRTAITEEKLKIIEIRDELKRKLDEVQNVSLDRERLATELKKLRNSMSVTDKEYNKKIDEHERIQIKLSSVKTQLIDASKQINNLENWFSVKAPKAQSSDVVVYNLSASEEISERVEGLLLYKGFEPDMAIKFRNPRKDKQAKVTTIFYYSNEYREVAQSLKKGMDILFGNKVFVLPGASSQKDNQIIIHLVG